MRGRLRLAAAVLAGSETADILQQAVMAAAAAAGSAGGDFADRAAETVHAFQNDVDHGWGEGEPSFASEVESGLHLVGDFQNRGELEEAGETLDGVESAKDRIDSVRVRRIPLEGEEPLFDGTQMLARFEDEIGDKLGVAREGGNTLWLREDGDVPPLSPGPGDSARSSRASPSWS